MDYLQKYDPEFKHVNDAIAFAVNISFLQNNSQLIGLNEIQFLEDLGSVPHKWNQNHELYQFRYISKKNINDKNKEQLTILIKILPINDNEMMISALQQKNNKNVFTLDIKIDEHIDIESYKKDKKKTNTHYKNLDSLLFLVNEKITKKVIDEPKKEEEKEDKQNKENPLIDYDDNQNFGIGGAKRPPPKIGDFDKDINPFGGIGGGFKGGNLMGPNDPKFRPHNDKPDNVPPDSRYDPVGPGPLGKKKRTKS